MKNLAAAFLIAIPSIGIGQDRELSSFELAESLGLLLASEDVCNLSFDQDAVADWITENVDPGDLEFVGMLARAIRMAGRSLDDIAGASKTAHCAAVEVSAGNEGLLVAS